MLEIVRDNENARFWPPQAFNVAAWAAALKREPSTINRWLKKIDAEVIVQTGNGEGENFIAIDDFYSNMPKFAGTPEDDKPKPKASSSRKRRR